MPPTASPLSVLRAPMRRIWMMPVKITFSVVLKPFRAVLLKILESWATCALVAVVIYGILF
jgi:hypothetical protein